MMSYLGAFVIGAIAGLALQAVAAFIVSEQFDLQIEGW